jgi:uncharacterized membrane protein
VHIFAIWHFVFPLAILFAVYFSEKVSVNHLFILLFSLALRKNCSEENDATAASVMGQTVVVPVARKRIVVILSAIVLETTVSRLTCPD